MSIQLTHQAHVRRLSVPARVNILGNPGDANEGDYATISAAINLRTTAEITPAEAYLLEQEGAGAVRFHPDTLPLPYDGVLDLLKGAVNALYALSPEFRERLPVHGFHLRCRTNVPRQSGLGGSSLFVLLTLAALRSYYALDPRTYNDYVLAELCQRVEEQELGIHAGFADRYAPLFGGLAYVDYRGKLHHAPLGEEPFATYERLDDYAHPLSFVVGSTGIRHDSGDVHGRMRPRYLDEHAAWSAGGRMPPMVRMMSAVWDCAWRGKIALLAGDTVKFGQLMTENHRLVDEMMRYCGFADGAGWANTLLIDAARDAGALGAKLTGAGGGGSVLALVTPGEEAPLTDVWRATAKLHGLGEARFYRLRIARRGIVYHKR